MPYHQPEWIWYVAQLVIDAQVEGQYESTLLIESVLIRAESPDQAYEKALAICASSEHVYRNRSGAVVRQRYLGVHELDNLQAEEIQDEQVLQVRVAASSPQCNAQNLLRSKNELSLFGGQSLKFLHLSQ